jgi:hypothetical protein
MSSIRQVKHTKNRSTVTGALVILLGCLALLASACSSSAATEPGSSSVLVLASPSATPTIPVSHPQPTATPTIPVFQPQPTFTPTSTPNIAGNYQGSYTVNGQSGTYTMQIQIVQSGTQLTGTTTEGSSTASDTGTISAGGSFSITENFSGSGTATLSGSLVGPGHLSGTWTNSTEAGSWDVTLV